MYEERARESERVRERAREDERESEQERERGRKRARESERELERMRERASKKEREREREREQYLMLLASLLPSRYFVHLISFVSDPLDSQLNWNIATVDVVSKRLKCV